MKPKQIIAARAMAGWKQAELAERAGCALTSITAVETGERELSSTIERKIIRAFEREGITFTEHGVDHKDTLTYEVKGPDFWDAVLEDVYETMKDQKNRDIILFCGDDSASPDHVNELWRKIRSLGVNVRQIVREGNTYLLGDINEYRWMPEEFFINYVTMVYGNDKVCICAEANTKAMIFKDKQMSRMMTNVFNWCWKNAKQPTETTAPDSQRF